MGGVQVRELSARQGGGPIAHPELSLLERREELREEGEQRGTSATAPAHGQRA
jgi:hypothetical protein